MADEHMEQDGVALEKRAARAAIRSALSVLSPTTRVLASRRVCQRVMGTGVFASAGTVMLFAPLADEVDLTPVLERCRETGRRVCAPRAAWATREMEPAEVGGTGWEKLVEARFGIREPDPDARAVKLEEIDLILVPAVAFDRSGHRLGRGGGFYDRFLARAELRRAFLLGVGFAVQLVTRTPRAEHDRPVDAVITDGEIVSSSEGIGARAQ